MPPTVSSLHATFTMWMKYQEPSHIALAVHESTQKFFCKAAWIEALHAICETQRMAARCDGIIADGKAVGVILSHRTQS